MYFLSSLSKVAIVFPVDCLVQRRSFHASKFCAIVAKFWKRTLAAYISIALIVLGISPEVVVCYVKRKVMLCTSLIHGLAWNQKPKKIHSWATYNLRKAPGLVVAAAREICTCNLFKGGSKNPVWPCLLII
ncbi:hypothetical protein VNO77_04036 [Canavalia gladiata]|uniref:Uncharacterized protein n=1 Tax=Canavalia gladiata TaxID=3824 RepID=A0AAN9R4G9_CANGL